MSDPLMGNYGLKQQRPLYDDFGNVLAGKFFVILNLERMREADAKPVFWKSHAAGYTDNVFLAGIYSEDQLKECCIYSDDLVIPIQEITELLRCDMEELKRRMK